MDQQALDKVGQNQRERLAYIEFLLWFLGDLRRPDLMERFDVGPAVATRDIASYREIAPENIVFNDPLKRYEVTSTFQPVFKYEVHKVLSALSRGYAEGFDRPINGFLTSEFPQQLNQPTVQVLAVVSRAIHQKKAIRAKYCSFTSGLTERELIPYALVDSGTRWHVRAFCRVSNKFKDFAINRIDDPVLLDDVKDNERPQHDHQWLKMLMVELVPHPQARFPKVVERDYSMEAGTLVLNLRAAVAGYVLQAWSVDCSKDHHLDPVRYRLWLKNADKILYQVESAVMAPGFESL